MVEDRHKRAPGFNERFYICRGTEGFYNNFNITVKYDKHVTAAALSIALKSLIRKNSWFTHNFFKKDGTDSAIHNGHNWTLQIVNQIRFDDVVSFEKIAHFNEKVLVKLNEQRVEMNIDKPLWRIIVFEEEENNNEQLICIYVDHSQFDGLSAVQFQKDLSRELALIDDDDDDDEKEENETKVKEILFDYSRDLQYLPNKVMPPAEYATDLYIPPLTTVVNYHLGRYVPFYENIYNWLYEPKRGEYPLFVNKSPIRKDMASKYNILKINPDTTVRITEFCRLHGVSVTAYLDIMVIKALQNSVFKAMHGTSQLSTTSYVAINGRRYYARDIQDFRFGSMVCGAEVYLPPIENDILFMQEFTKQLTTSIKSKNAFKAIGMLQYKNAWKLLNDKIGKIGGGRQTFTISNLGKMTDSNNIYKFKEMYFGASVGVMYNLVVNITTLPNNELTIVFGYLPEFESLYLDNKNAIEVFTSLFKQYVNNV
ncbi:hypothetical protein KGF56_000567 [Candida oxycetoniae]|uniref:Alcohol acetyltransferase n=1 Tax=Candida oxycetoniae TaxID=497107 RepID=A0AAI9T1S1_9ASCO|nr:uncharacterized protein KGF56_000567 [Candida oxycetoniae]KAI3406721.2 hypothetical protein KGF56_000567 [Candida oxycetoniae]